MTKPKFFDLEVTEKGKAALAYALTGFLAHGMEYSDLIEYYIDTKVAYYMEHPNEFKKDLEIHADDMLEFIGEMNKRLT